jgi:hypothetical protein
MRYRQQQISSYDAVWRRAARQFIFLNEANAVLSRLQLLRQEYGVLKSNIDIDVLVNKLEKFHNDFAKGCSHGNIDLNKIN